MRILIVEDDFVNRKLMTACLCDIGECDVATTGTEAIEAFTLALSEEKPYNLIMLDIMMPEMNGQEALKRIRLIEDSRKVQIGNNVKIIMTTALKDSDNVMAAFENQCDGYLVKPIDLDKMQALMASLNLIPA